MELLQQEIVRIFFGVLQIRKVKEKVVSMVVESSQSEDVRVVVSPYRICPLGAHIDHQVMFASSLQVHKMKAELNFQDDKTPPPHWHPQILFAKQNHFLFKHLGWTASRQQE
jgi:hypothetical protein